MYFIERDIRQEKVREEFMGVLRQINQCGEDIKRLQQRDNNDDSTKRTSAFRRYFMIPLYNMGNIIAT